MDVIFHRLIPKDLRAALAYYDAEGGSRLGNRFFRDLEATIAEVIENPQRFHYIEEGLRRRAPLRVFPYHLVYEGTTATIRFLVLRHDRRHPRSGLRRR